MARVKISEYTAKRLLFGDEYRGVQLKKGKMALPKGRYVLKVDQGVKKRMKQGLVAIDTSAPEMRRSIAEWTKKGYSQFLAEPLVPHDRSDEQYFSLERVRSGLRMLHAREGGIDIEEHPEAVQSYLITGTSDVAKIAAASQIPETFLNKVVEAFEKYHFAFLEINPLVVAGDSVHALDAAVLLDSAGEFFVRGAWTGEDILKTAAKHPAEERVVALAATTPASLKLTVIDPNGALFFLLSGGGGSIVIADEAQLQGVGDRIANYGEYSGGPTREETYLYAKEILALLIDSTAPKKALVIAGGVANFTDVRTTFLGIIDALKERADELRQDHVKVFVRRGGPNEAQGLSLMQDFLGEHGILGSVSGSDTIITDAVDAAIRYVRA